MRASSRRLASYLTNLSVDLANTSVPGNFMAVVKTARQVQRLLTALICIVGWHRDVHGQEGRSSTPSLEVVGEIRMEARLEPLDETRLRLSGSLTDEVGQPISATLLVEAESEANVIPCGDETRSVPESGSNLLVVPPSGEICGLVLGQPDTLKLLAQAPHYMSAASLVTHLSQNHLASPRFTQAPQTMRLRVPVSLELLVGQHDNPLPTDARVSLHLLCPGGTQLLGERPAVGIPLVRFEVIPKSEAVRGACQLSAVTRSGSQSSRAATRNVLVQDVVHLNLESLELEQERAIIFVKVMAGARDVEGGLVEARGEGVFLVGSAVEKGIARLEVERSSTLMEIELAYLPSDDSLLPGPSITVSIPPVRSAKTWTGAHLLGLVAFSGWLVFVWLRPRSLSSATAQRVPSLRKPGGTTHESTRGLIEGLIRDAHTGRPIPGARLILSAPGPVEQNELERGHSRADGTFGFRTNPEASTLLKLRVEGDSHLSLETTITSRQLTVYLTERKRAVIQNLVAWAKRRGTPWYTGVPPTPGGVERTAVTRNEALTEVWAGAVERAVYSGLPLSEQEVLELKSPKTSTTTRSGSED
jgi:hypothetical protein